MAVAQIKNDKSLPQIEHILAQSSLLSIDKAKIMTALPGMLDAASYYENWRTTGLDICGGLTLVLGSIEAETSWTKLIPKKSDNFAFVVRRLKEVGIPELATRYAHLEKVLIDHKVNTLLQGEDSTCCNAHLLL